MAWSKERQREYMQEYRRKNKEKIRAYMREYHQNNKYDHRLKGIWRAMINRCTDPRNISYKYYGGKGVSVCDEWVDDYEKFERWAFGNGYKSDLTIDRIDSNKGYCPDNCRWATKKQQQNNTSYNRKITFSGTTHSMKEWSELTGIGYYALYNRMRRGWSVERALTTNQHTYRKEG